MANLVLEPDYLEEQLPWLSLRELKVPQLPTFVGGLGVGKKVPQLPTFVGGRRRGTLLEIWVAAGRMETSNSEGLEQAAV